MGQLPPEVFQCSTQLHQASIKYLTCPGFNTIDTTQPKTKGRTRDSRQTGRIGEAWSRCLKVPPPVQPPTTKPVMHHWVSGQNCLRPWPETCFMSGHYNHWNCHWQNGKKSKNQWPIIWLSYFGKVTSATGQFHQNSHLVPRIAGLGCSLCRLDLMFPHPVNCAGSAASSHWNALKIWDSRPCYWSNAFQPARQSRWPFVTRNTWSWLSNAFTWRSRFFRKKYIECPLKTSSCAIFRVATLETCSRSVGRRNILRPLPTTSSPELGAARYLPAEWRHHEVWCAWRQLPLPSTMSQELFISQCLKK